MAASSPGGANHSSEHLFNKVFKIYPVTKDEEMPEEEDAYAAADVAEAAAAQETAETPALDHLAKPQQNIKVPRKSKEASGKETGRGTGDDTKEGIKSEEEVNQENMMNDNDENKEEKKENDGQEVKEEEGAEEKKMAEEPKLNSKDFDRLVQV